MNNNNHNFLLQRFKKIPEIINLNQKIYLSDDIICNQKRYYKFFKDEKFTRNNHRFIL